MVLAAVCLVVGVLLVIGGLAWAFPPAAVVAAGLVLAWFGLTRDDGKGADG